MGKRELLLIVCFVIVGAVVYQATAPPPDPGARTFSFSRIIEAARREISGNRARTERTVTSTEPIPADITEIRVVGNVAEVEVTGDKRPDVGTSLRVRSNAYDDDEAKKYAAETTLLTDHAGSSLVFRVKYPEGRHTGRQWAYLTLNVPSRIKVRVESGTGKLAISNVAAVELPGSRGDTTLKNIAGRVSIVHRGGPVRIENVETLKFTGRNTDLKVTSVRGDTSILMEQGGELEASQLAGAIDVESRNADVKLSNLEPARGPIRVNINGGSARLDGLKTDTRVDSRNSEVDIVMRGAAPVVIYTDGDDLALTPPPDGYKLDAVVTGGRIAPETVVTELGLEHTGGADDEEARASGSVKGGGPTITIRATRGDLTLRLPEKPKQ